MSKFGTAVQISPVQPQNRDESSCGTCFGDQPSNCTSMFPRILRRGPSKDRSLRSVASRLADLLVTCALQNGAHGNRVSQISQAHTKRWTRCARLSNRAPVELWCELELRAIPVEDYLITTQDCYPTGRGFSNSPISPEDYERSSPVLFCSSIHGILRTYSEYDTY